MKLDKAKRRSKKQHKSRHGMGVDNRSIFTIVDVLKNRKDKNKKESDNGK